jgi:nucleoside-diphosphate-sugar epimerase
MSAESKRHARATADRRISQRLRDGEHRLFEQCGRLGIECTVLRPTMIYGAGLDRNLTPIARRAARWGVFPMPIASGLRQPVHAEDVAAASILALQRSEASGQTIEIGGGERLSVTTMFERVRASLPCPTLPLRISGRLLRAGARLQPMLRGPLDRLDTNLVADNARLERLLGMQPRPFHPVPATWGFETR